MPPKTREEKLKEFQDLISGVETPFAKATAPAPVEKSPYKVVTEKIAIERAKNAQAARDIATGGAPQTLQGGAVIGGKTYLGLNKEDIAKVGGKSIGEANITKGAIEAAGQLGQLNPELLQNMQEAPIDWGQALTAGAVKGVIPSALGGLAIGAGAGALAGGVGAIPGAIVGLIGGAIKGMYSNTVANIESQKKGEIRASQDVLTFARQNLRQLAIVATQDPANADKYMKSFNDQLTLIHRARSQIKLETEDNLDKFVEDGTDILSDFDLFLMEGGLADIYENKIKLALAGGISLTEEDLTQSEI